ncbi:hypothetical protein EYZ11_011787 [Aspergillus tanneri]|uniref:Uncharacterized protein n=1 Tax=Aspergillus tanneri TaxID=1220188 RepID=A0A4V3UMV1_9EURO|nr:hypothetical protein EYZ11_011787 [Aspergillus tanneri]
MVPVTGIDEDYRSMPKLATQK